MSQGTLEIQEDENAQTKQVAKAAVSGWLGTALEYVDFQLYGLAAAMVFNTIFFPEVSPAVGLIASMATYGTGYVARLLGAWFFGRMGDRIGRKHVLVITIGLMGGASTLIGFLPTYQQVGILAPILLMVLRLIQGFGAGAEISGSAILLTEYAPVKRRGLMGSLVGLGTNSGTLLASGFWLLIIQVFGDERLMAWAWRIPFLCSFLLMLLAVWIRKHLEETPVFLARADVVDGVAISKDELIERARESAADSDLASAVKQKRGKAFLLASMLRFGHMINSAMIQTFLAGFLTATLLVSKTVPTAALFYGSLLGFVTVPLVGWLGDRIGRRNMYLIGSGIAVVVAWPLLHLIMSGSTWGINIGIILILNLTVLNLFALENVTLPELFGARTRYMQVSLAKEVPGVLATMVGTFGAAALTVATGSWWPLVAMVVIGSLCVFVATLLGPDVTRRDLDDLADAL